MSLAGFLLVPAYDGHESKSNETCILFYASNKIILNLFIYLFTI